MLFFHKSNFQIVKSNGLSQANSCGECEDDKEGYMEEEFYILIYQLIIIVWFLYPLCLSV